MNRELRAAIKRRIDSIERQVEVRTFRISNELRNTALYVLAGQRSGRRYRRGKRYHTASAPGEAPAVDTGRLRRSWLIRSYNPQSRVQYGTGRTFYANIETNTPYAEYLDPGTARIAQRPYREPIRDKTMTKATRILKEPYR